MDRKPCLLNLLVSFLTIVDRAFVRQVSRAFKQACDDQELNLNDFLSVFFADFTSFPYTLHSLVPEVQPWQVSSGLLQSLIAKHYLAIHGSGVLQQWARKVAGCLQAPAVELPQLRAEHDTFPTLFQDAIAHPECELFLENTVLDPLQAQVDALAFEVSLSQATQELKRPQFRHLRWNLPGPEPALADSPLLLQLAKVLKKLTRLHCRAVLQYLLLVQQQELVEQYATLVAPRQWEAFVHSCKNLEPEAQLWVYAMNLASSQFDPLPGPALTLVRWMAVIWRREVLDKCFDSLVKASLQLLDTAEEDEDSASRLQK